MFDDIPDNYRSQTADNPEEGWRYTLGDKNARRPPELLDARSRGALHHARSEGRPRQPARRRVPRHRVDQGKAARTRRSTSRRSCPACTTSSSSWPTSTSPRADGSGADHALHHGRRARRWRYADVDGAGAVCGRRSAPAGCTAPIASAATRCPICWCSVAGPVATPRSSRRQNSAGTIDEDQIDQPASSRRWPRSSAVRRAKTRTRSSATCRT